MFIFNLSDSTSDSASRCVELVRRHAPRFMVAGGGPLREERRCQPNAGRPLSLEREAIVRALVRRGNLSRTEIAQRAGVSRSTVRRIAVGRLVNR